MADKKKNTRVRKSTKEELSFMLDSVKKEITNATKNLVVDEVKNIKEEIKDIVVGEVKNLIKSTEKKLNKKVANVNENVGRLEESIKENETIKEIESTKEIVEDTPIIDEEFIPIENKIINLPIEIEDENCVGRLISRENYPITIRYDGGKMVISPREIKKGIIKNLIEEKIPKGIMFIKDF